MNNASTKMTNNQDVTFKNSPFNNPPLGCESTGAHQHFGMATLWPKRGPNPVDGNFSGESSLSWPKKSDLAVILEHPDSLRIFLRHWVFWSLSYLEEPALNVQIGKPASQNRAASKWLHLQ